MRLIPLFALVCVIASCASPSHEEIDFNANSPEFERFDDPFSIDETRTLRDGFSWTATTDLPEVDPDGRPALFYMIAYVGSDEDATLLDAMGQHSPLPLFAAERTRWARSAQLCRSSGDLSEAGGRTIRYTPIDDATFAANLSGALPPDYIGLLVTLFGTVRQGFASHVDPSLRTLLGRAPLTLQDYARDHAALFRA